MEVDMTEKSAARTLDAIRNGGGNMILMCRQRINEAVKALDDGEFSEAQQRLTEAISLTAPLAHAEQYLGVADTGRMVRVKDLEVGMKLTQIGEVAEITEGTCDHEACPGHFAVRIGENEPLVLDGDATLYVEVEVVEP